MVVIQFCSFPSLMSHAIEWFTEGTVGHVDMVTEKGTLLGAQEAAGLGGKPSGVQERPFPYGGMRDPIRFALDMPGAQEHDFRTFMWAQEGKPYDVEAIAAFVAGREWRRPDAWFCSELVAAALEASGFLPHPILTPVNKITPSALLILVSALGSRVAVPALG